MIPSPLEDAIVKRELKEHRFRARRHSMFRLMERYGLTFDDAKATYIEHERRLWNKEGKHLRDTRQGGSLFVLRDEKTKKAFYPVVKTRAVRCGSVVGVVSMIVTYLEIMMVCENYGNDEDSSTAQGDALPGGPLLRPVLDACRVSACEPNHVDRR